MTDHANELRRYSRKIGHPAGDVPSVMLAAAGEIERLAARLEAAEKERDALRAELDALKSREGEVVYRWLALDYSGFCYGSNPPDNLPNRCNLKAFYAPTRSASTLSAFCKSLTACHTTFRRKPIRPPKPASSQLTRA